MSQITEYRVAERIAKQSIASRFRIVEVLVIAGILAILAAILLPVIGKAKENAKYSSCQSNLKQLGLGVMQYVQDFDEAFPRLAIFTSASTVGPNSVISWRQALYPYTKSLNIFKCPSNPILDNISIIDGYPQSYEVTDTGPIRLDQQITLNDVSSPATISPV